MGVTDPVNRKVLLLAAATLVFAIGYGIFLADLVLAGGVGRGELAGALMGGGLLVSMAVGTWALVELQQFLGRTE